MIDLCFCVPAAILSGDLIFILERLTEFLNQILLPVGRRFFSFAISRSEFGDTFRCTRSSKYTEITVKGVARGKESLALFDYDLMSVNAL